jgi:1-phosphofructokinase family hexose kinase
VILCVGGTPAVQRTMRFASLKAGEVNRASEVQVTASGKVVNAARVATALGGRALVATFLGGDAGRFVARELDAEEVAHDAVWAEDDAPTRTCVTLLPDGGPVTELVEEAPPVSERDVAALEAAVSGRLPEAKALCLIGSLPPGVLDDAYARFAAAARDAGVPALVDAQGALLRSSLAARPFLVKPNLQEASAALGLGTGEDPEAEALAAVDALVGAGAQWALVSMGASGSVLGDAEGGRWIVEPPRIEARNPIGSGDSLAAGLLLAVARGASVPDAAAYGTACAAANALTITAGVVDPDDVDALAPRVRLAPLHDRR